MRRSRYRRSRWWPAACRETMLLGGSVVVGNRDVDHSWFDTIQRRAQVFMSLLLETGPHDRGKLRIA